ncbi:hypothetical protein HJC06_14285 [Rhizobium sp. NLR9b]|uniref:hypothetical protein n=1 Tax=unclassified Rhizobium TaxID=2613769 RepID=UPI001C836334|nr:MULTISPECIES: hypothetical protein [unclassified Rhizobium]MBX5227575.1 hypothetical protein [Rhizobium sp. NLR9b]MBX5288619.1 hypothetical protein [Rhizobium sp. NLR10b]
MKIRSISADLFSFEGNLDWTNPVAIRIELSNKFAIRVRCSSDGESLIADNQALEGPVDMAGFGKIEVHQLTDHIDEAILSSEIATLNEILDGNNSVVGLAFIHNETTMLCIWNYGDELHYGNFATMVKQQWGAALRVSPKCYELR